MARHTGLSDQIDAVLQSFGPLGAMGVIEKMIQVHGSSVRPSSVRTSLSAGAMTGRYLADRNVHPAVYAHNPNYVPRVGGARMAKEPRGPRPAENRYITGGTTTRVNKKQLQRVVRLAFQHATDSRDRAAIDALSEVMY